MTLPINPPPHSGALGDELPAYLANGLIGLRVRDLPLTPGMTLVSGFTGEHPSRNIESAAPAPYPVAGDVVLNGVTLSQAQQQVTLVDQAYDFGCGELTTRLEFRQGEVTARITVLTFCSHDSPSLVCQETQVVVDGPCDLTLTAAIDASTIPGVLARARRDIPGGDAECDGWMLWRGAGDISTCGLAYVTELTGAKAEAGRPAWREGHLTSSYGFRAASNRSYCLRQVVSMVPSVIHPHPDEQAARLAALARKIGFETLRRRNREVWEELWRGRIRLEGANEHWQRLADAGLFYLLTSTHPSSPASTSIFGLATWRGYHYYYGHVMWDIDTFCVPTLTMLAPDAASSLLDYRFRCLPGAEANARARGRRGAQFAWESAPSTGHEAAPLPGSASWFADHVTPDVARAFAFYADATGDEVYRRDRVWPVLSKVAEWITSRVEAGKAGYEIRQSMGIAEREQAVDNPAYMNMVSATVLRDAVRTAQWMGVTPPAVWERIADGLALPIRDGMLVSHSGYRANETKGATPDPLMGLFPLAYPLAEKVQQRTLDFYLERADDYLGSPMLSALYASWAGRTGDRRLVVRMLEEGYAKFLRGRFLQTLEYRQDRFPEQPPAGPFCANIGGFLSGLLLGLPGLEVDGGPVDAWPKRDVTLPTGWDAICAERVWLRGRPARLIARHGKRTELTWLD